MSGFFPGWCHSARDFNWSLSDVSVLFPLPESLESSELFTPKSSGRYGELLPLGIVERIPALNPAEKNAITYKNLKAVALRIDPDRSQIRIVFQPLQNGVEPWEMKGTSVLDMAVHVFYALTPTEFQVFLQDYLKLKSTFGIAGSLTALNVHPVLQKENMRGPYSQAFKKLFLQGACCIPALCSKNRLKKRYFSFS